MNSYLGGPGSARTPKRSRFRNGIISIYICLYISIYIHVVYIYMCVCVYVSIYMYRYVLIYSFLFRCTGTSASAKRNWPPKRRYIYIYIYVCIYLYTYLLYMYVYVYIYVCVCLTRHFHSLGGPRSARAPKGTRLRKGETHRGHHRQQAIQEEDAWKVKSVSQGGQEGGKYRRRKTV